MWVESMYEGISHIECFFAGWLNYNHLKSGGENMTKRNIKTKSGKQSAKSITSTEFASEMKPQDKKTEKTRPSS